MSRLAALRPVLPILVGASLMLSLASGLRHSLGIFMPNLTRDLAMPVADFTLALAVQSLAWGILQPFAGALAVRIGYRPLMLAGCVVYVGGLLLLASAGSLLPVIIGAGIAIGAAMACTGPPRPWPWLRVPCRRPCAARCWASSRPPARSAR